MSAIFMKQEFLLIVITLLLTVSAFAQADQPRMIDEFGVIPCDEYLARVDAAINEQYRNPGSQIYVFIYEGKEEKPVYKNGRFVGNKAFLPQYGLAKVKIESMKKYIKLRKISLDNYVFARG